VPTRAGGWLNRLSNQTNEGEQVLTLSGFADEIDDGFDGFFSLEPHLGEYTAFGALSGPEMFTRAWQAFTDILNSEGISYA
jgi:hypothetical protein